MSEERIKKRRLGSGQACISCRKRKNRCDGQRPECGSCQSRWISCNYPPEVRSARSTERSGDFALHNLQDTPSGSVEQQSSPPSNLSPATGRGSLSVLWNSTDILRSSEENDQNEGPPSYPEKNTQQNVSIGGQNVDSGVSSPGDSGGPDGYFGDSSSFAFVSKVQPKSQKDNGVYIPSKRSRGMSTSQSVPTPGSMSRIQGENDTRYKLPQRCLADSLVDGYFDRVHPLYPFVHEVSFRAEYERMWENVSESVLRPSWYAVLNIIFASSCEFCDAIPEEDVIHTVSPFVARSRDIIFSQIFRSGNLELVQALLLMCHYLQGTLELNECWNLAGLMIRTAVSIGLHLNPEELSLTTVERETRKRVWWGCYIIDRTLSMKFGRPPSVQALDVFDVQFPSAVDDQYIHNDSLTPRQPVAQPSIIAFFIHTIRLSQVIDNILRDLYTNNRKASRQKLRQNSAENSVPSSFGKSYTLGHAVLLDGQLQAWWDDVPDHLRPESTSADGKIFQRQKIVMQIRFLQIRILLQRQLLVIFSREEIEDDFLRAIAIAGSRTCISAARQTIRLIHTQYCRRLLNSLCYNLHYIFTSMGVLLHLHTMDKSRLELLGYEPEEESLEWGMEFIVAASSKSALAARYVTMLQRVRGQSKQDSAQTNDMTHMATASTEQIPSQSNGLHNWWGEIDLDGMNFDDLLFGTGLPQDVMSFDYPNGGFLL